MSASMCKIDSLRLHLLFHSRWSFSEYIFLMEKQLLMVSLHSLFDCLIMEELKTHSSYQYCITILEYSRTPFQSPAFRASVHWLLCFSNNCNSAIQSYHEVALANKGDDWHFQLVLTFFPCLNKPRCARTSLSSFTRKRHFLHQEKRWRPPVTKRDLISFLCRFAPPIESSIYISITTKMLFKLHFDMRSLRRTEGGLWKREFCMSINGCKLMFQCVVSRGCFSTRIPSARASHRSVFSAEVKHIQGTSA